MKKTCILALSFSLLTMQVQASTEFLCSGKYQGKSIVINGSIKNLTNPKSGHGTISVNGREVADFDGADAKINIIFLTVKVKNSRGEILEAKATNLADGTGMITRLRVPGFGIDFKNISMSCVEK